MTLVEKIETNDPDVIVFAVSPAMSAVDANRLEYIDERIAAASARKALAESNMGAAAEAQAVVVAIWGDGTRAEIVRSSDGAVFADDVLVEAKIAVAFARKRIDANVVLTSE